MKDTLPLWTPYLETSVDNKGQLETISAASIDRLLRGFKVQAGKKPRPPKPASGVKNLVEIRAESWDTCDPGWTEVDTVAHCGGEFLNYFVYDWLKGKGIHQTRSRPYFKNGGLFHEIQLRILADKRLISRHCKIQ